LKNEAGETVYELAKENSVMLHILTTHTRHSKDTLPSITPSPVKHTRAKKKDSPARDKAEATAPLDSESDCMKETVSGESVETKEDVVTLEKEDVFEPEKEDPMECDPEALASPREVLHFALLVIAWIPSIGVQYHLIL
jgi:hypothetical protein